MKPVFTLTIDSKQIIINNKTTDYIIIDYDENGIKDINISSEIVYLHPIIIKIFSILTYFLQIPFKNKDLIMMYYSCNKFSNLEEDLSSILNSIVEDIEFIYDPITLFVNEKVYVYNYDGDLKLQSLTNLHKLPDLADIVFKIIFLLKLSKAMIDNLDNEDKLRRFLKAIRLKVYLDNDVPLKLYYIISNVVGKYIPTYIYCSGIRGTEKYIKSLFMRDPERELLLRDLIALQTILKYSLACDYDLKIFVNDKTDEIYVLNNNYTMMRIQITSFERLFLESLVLKLNLVRSISKGNVEENEIYDICSSYIGNIINELNKFNIIKNVNMYKNKLLKLLVEISKLKLIKA